MWNSAILFVILSLLAHQYSIYGFSAKTFKHEIVSFIENCWDSSCERVELTIMSPSRTFLLDLQKMHNLFSDDYFEQIGNREPVKGRSASQYPEFDCLYNSINPSVRASISICGEGIEGSFSTKDGSFSLHFDHDLQETCLFESKDMSSDPIPYSLLSSGDIHELLEASLAEWKAVIPERSVEELSARALGDGEMFVEILLIFDSDAYHDYFKSSLVRVRQFVAKYAAYVNEMYHMDPFQVNIVIIGLIVWTEGDPSPFDRIGNCNEQHCPMSQRMNDLANFGLKHLYPKYHQDSVVVFSPKIFPGTRGISIPGTTCNSPELAIHIVRLEDPLELILNTAAHELGHNLGFEDNSFSREGERECGVVYDDRRYPRRCWNGGCPDDKVCIMNACSIPGVRAWDKCSIKIFEMRKEAGKFWCLLNRPLINAKKENKEFSHCGNGVIEFGETCDCTESDIECQNCCAKTCQLNEKAECASGPCCESTSCSFKTIEQTCSTIDSSDPCSAANTTCTGNSAFCPDMWTNDGKSCSSDAKKICFKGRCTSKCPRDCYGNGDCVGNMEEGFKCDCYTMYYGSICYARHSLAIHFAYGLVLGICAFFTTLIIFRMIDLRRAGWKYQKMRED